MQRIISVLLAALFVAAAGSARAQIEIDWWHAMTGTNNTVVEQLAREFNATRNDFRIVPIFKGTYPETLRPNSRRPAPAIHLISCKCSTSAPA